jgi:hypothetical protein
MQFCHKMALHVTAIAKPTINVLNNGDTVPCPFPWLSGVKPAPALVLLVWMVHYSFFAACHEEFALDGQMITSSGFL